MHLKLAIISGWNSNTKTKPNSRKSFGNVFAAAAAEDEERAELGRRFANICDHIVIICV